MVRDLGRTEDKRGVDGTRVDSSMFEMYIMSDESSVHIAVFALPGHSQPTGP